MGPVAAAFASINRGRKPGAAGFTLGEILVVLVILGIAAGAAAIAYDGNDRDRAGREAHRFANAKGGEHALKHSVDRRDEELGALLLHLQTVQR